MVWHILRRLALRLTIMAVAAIVSAFSIGWFSDGGVNSWRSPRVLLNRGISLMQEVVNDDELMADFVEWAENPDIEVAWAQALMRTRGPGNAEAFTALERAHALAPERPDIVLVRAYARAADSDCNGLRLARLYEEMCRKGADCEDGGDPSKVKRSLSQCRRPRPDEDPESAARTVVGSLKSCREDYLDNSDAEAYALCTARVENGDGAAAFDVGQLYILGHGVDRDYGRAKAWLERGAELSHL
jgi:TPR repeat protein